MHERINYIELPSSNFVETRRFFESVFDWKFTPYGADYLAFNNAGIDGGFYHSDLKSKAKEGAALVVFYSEQLELTQTKIVQAGGITVVDIFEFPGGRRFHFSDPTGNEFAVWSDKKPKE